MRSQKLSLTKSDISAGIGAELLTLCQSVTHDGRLTKEGIKELSIWLNKNRTSDLPSIAFLTSTVARVIADKKITKEERTELYRAIESILPPQARKQAVAARKTFESDERKKSEQAKDLREERERNEQIAKAEQARLNREVMFLDCMIAGVHFEGRPAIIRRHASEGDRVFLVRDTNNKFSRNAVKIVLSNGNTIGFVPEEDAMEVSTLLDRGCKYTAKITKILTGGSTPIPIVRAHFFSANASAYGLTPSDFFPSRSIARQWWKFWK